MQPGRLQWLCMRTGLLQASAGGQAEGAAPQPVHADRCARVQVPSCRTDHLDVTGGPWSGELEFWRGEARRAPLRGGATPALEKAGGSFPVRTVAALGPMLTGLQALVGTTPPPAARPAARLQLAPRSPAHVTCVRMTTRAGRAAGLRSTHPTCLAQPPGLWPGLPAPGPGACACQAAGEQAASAPAWSLLPGWWGDLGHWAATLQPLTRAAAPAG